MFPQWGLSQSGLADYALPSQERASLSILDECRGSGFGGQKAVACSGRDLMLLSLLPLSTRANKAKAFCVQQMSASLSLVPVRVAWYFLVVF